MESAVTADKGVVSTSRAGSTRLALRSGFRG